ncbi:serine/threonine protein kinase [Bacillus sp. DJP31]|uniref:serine/threonine protein kinase n=1 Tax=Bacillus sp. DJP31 TaxID=3409789 RepID=UPI003BB4DE38
MQNWIADLLERPLNIHSFLHNRYKVIRFIGKGSYGMVYLALDQEAMKTVVVKQLRKRKSKVRLGLLQREAKMLASLTHPSIPRFIDFFQEDQKSFLVMEFVDGRNVEELLFHEGRTFNEKESLQLLLEVLKVVEYLHQQKIIHRDLRLPNILINEQEVFVIDFGLAAVLGKQIDPISLESMPLEKRLYREMSVTSDFYALGQFLLFLLYSQYEVTRKKDLSWEEELILQPETIMIIRRLLKLNRCYEDVRDIITDIENAMILNSSCLQKDETT